MKSKIMLLATVLLCGISTAFSQGDQAQWPELKTFHSFMSSTFHPAEEGNFVPLKEKADSLLVAAKNWQASAIPVDFKPEKTRATLAKLVNQCTAIKKAVDSRATNDKLKKMITEAHGTFHTLVGECRKAEE